MKRIAIALTLLLAPLAVLPAAAEDIGFVTAVSGAATLARAAAVHPLVFKDALRWRDVVQTGSESSARLLILGKASVTVRELSQLQLREESGPGGRTHVVELAAGKVRTAVEHSLMSAGERVEVHAPNAIAAVRGTEFVVDVLAPPGRPEAFAMLASDSGRPATPRDGGAGTTVVYTLSGLVSVDNPLSRGGGRVFIGPYEGVRVEGTREPAPFRFSHVELVGVLRGLSVPPPPTRSPLMSAAATVRVEKMALSGVDSPVTAARVRVPRLRGALATVPAGLGGPGRDLPAAGAIGSIAAPGATAGTGISPAAGGNSCPACGSVATSSSTPLDDVAPTVARTVSGRLRPTPGKPGLR